MRAVIFVVTSMASGSLYANELIQEEVTIIGSKERVQQVTGSAHFVGPDDLKQFYHSDVQRIARQIPGVSLQVEDGYGLRPNIGIRGVPTERSARITLLEDNVLIAPAPYSAPSAYYFPTPGRIHSFEVVKGPAAITQGPYTIGGALNMISTPIPEDAQGKLLLEAGEDATYRLHGHYGQRTEQGFGFLLETHQWLSDGFQSIDRSSQDSGLDLTDYTLKLSYAPEGSRHAVDFKYQYADQESEQSYLGLTDADFDDDAYRRYGLSALDNIETEHEQFILRYRFSVTDDVRLSATAYNNEHERNWFKTEGIDFDGSANAQEFSRTSWFNVIDAINRGESLGGFSAAQLQGILDGTVDTAAGSIQLRSNAREYYSRGVQFQLDWDFVAGDVTHELEVGVRYHEDEEDRLQRNSSYRQENGALILDDFGLLGNAGNRIQDAEAVAIHFYDRISFGDWVFTPGLRYEDISQSRIRYETRTDRTADPSSRAGDNVRDTRENDTQVWIPGLGALYRVNEQASIFAGIHKGFSAPSNAPDVDEEESINYELGLRFERDNLSAELVGFLNDYDNLVGVCTASSGSDCEIGDAFNGDGATVLGLEALLRTELSTAAAYSIPLQVTYTYSDSEFDSDIADTDFFGDVSEGDPIPYIPENQVFVTLGFVMGSSASYLSVNYVDDVCVRASCDEFEQTDDTLTLDVSTRYDINSAASVFAKVENLTEADDIVGRQPYGARPNKARTGTIGVSFAF